MAVRYRWPALTHPTLERNGVALAIEPLNRFETFFLNTSCDAKTLCEEVGHPAVGVLFDTFHANIEEKSIAEGLRTIGSRLKHVHACENDRGIPGSDTSPGGNCATECGSSITTDGS